MFLTGINLGTQEGKMNRRLVSTIAGTIIVGSAIGIAVAQVKSVADANAAEPELVAQEMTAGEMINYLKERGAPFILETTDLPKDRKFEVNLKGASQEEAIKAIAEALNLKVTQEGKAFVLENPAQDFNFDFKTFGENGPMFMFKGEGFDKFGESMGELFDDPKLWKELEGKQEKDWTPEQRAKFEAKMKEFEKRMEEFGKNFKFEFDETQMKAFGERMEKFGKDFEFKFNEGDLKEWEEHAKAFKMDAKDAEELAKKLSEQAKKYEKLRFSEKDFGVRITDVKKLIDSISDAQWKKMKEQGHLKISDLTPAQKEMLGGLKGSHKDLNITISSDDKTLKIQGE